ncbi:Neural-cadherin-like protein, partial [Leptotrombidium deliense]
LAGGRFEVDELSGEVRTRGNEPFLLDKEYVLYVKAEDHNGPLGDRQFQSTKEERLSIMGGRRPPQFFKSKYATVLSENETRNADVITVKAKSFGDRDIRYTLKTKGKGSGTFNIGPTSGIVKLASKLDYEDIRQPKEYLLLVTATEDSGGLSSSVEVKINVTDVNDNAPHFELDDYHAHIDEDIAIGSSILRVSAKDADSGKNAEIIYSLDSELFRIDNRGVIYSNRRLDADVNNIYRIKVKASDKGDQLLTATATATIYTENKNDEPPQFSQLVYTSNVDKNAAQSTLVTAVIANDKDGDNILFGFVEGDSQSGMFHIDERTGVIRLINGSIHLTKHKYELNVTAKDDGSCCKNGKQTIHTSTALVVVFITDSNENKPIFKDCQKYAATVEEGAPNGTYVITVKASDSDNGLNGVVRYSIVQQPNQEWVRFTVDEITGEIKTNKVFDREGDDGRFVSLTVKAVDRGAPPLEGVCSLKVAITDINDNPPLFHRKEYKENVKQDTEIGTNILRVSAFDKDAENNGTITYNLTAAGDSSDLEYFVINPVSGWIALKKQLTKGQFHLIAVAMDKGVHQLSSYAGVFINVIDSANNYPVWEQPVYGPISIKENIEVGRRVIS